MTPARALDEKELGEIREALNRHDGSEAYVPIPTVQRLLATIDSQAAFIEILRKRLSDVPTANP